MTHFIIPYHISLVNVQTNYCKNNLLILDVQQLNKIMKLYYVYTLKALWDCQGKNKMYYGVSRVKKQLSGNRSIIVISYIKKKCTKTLKKQNKKIYIHINRFSVNINKLKNELAPPSRMKANVFS